MTESEKELLDLDELTALINDDWEEDEGHAPNADSLEPRVDADIASGATGESSIDAGDAAVDELASLMDDGFSDDELPPEEDVETTNVISGADSEQRTPEENPADLLTEMETIRRRMAEIEEKLKRGDGATVGNGAASASTAPKRHVAGYMKGLREEKTGQETKITSTKTVKSFPAQVDLRRLESVKSKLQSRPRLAPAADSLVAKTTASELFGDMDDDEELRENLSGFGAQIQNNLNKQNEKELDAVREREVVRLATLREPTTRLSDLSSRLSTTPASHSANQNLPQSRKAAASMTETAASSKNTLSAPPVISNRTCHETVSQNCETETLTGLRVRNPKVSVFGLQAKMKSKRVVRMSRIKAFIRNGAIEGEWVSLAVVVTKAEPRTSSKGNSYSVWTLSDLEDCDLKVSLFLFGETFKQHWKTATGSVIGIVNATVMPPRDKKNSEEVALTVDQPQKLLVVGESPDLGHCKATKKNGDKCKAFVNAAKSDFCTFHVQKAYNRMGSKRGEFQSAMTGHAPKRFQRQQLAKKILGGGSEFYYGGKTYTAQSLPGFGSATPATNPSQKRKSDLEKLAGLNRLPGGAGVEEFRDTIKTQMASKHNLSSDIASQVTAGLKGGKEFHERMTRPTAGSRLLMKHLVDQEEEEKKKIIAPKSAKDLLREASAASRSPQPATAKRGIDNEDDDDAAFSVEFGFTSTSKLSSKAAAIAKIKAAGGIKKEDPNAVKEARLAKIKNENRREGVKRRLNDSADSAAKAPSSSSSSQEDSSSPAPKKAKMLDLDLNSPEGRRLLKGKSAHAGALSERRAEEEEAYFGALEKKERMAEQMSKITKIKCKVVTCKVCKYTSVQPSEECRAEHPQALVYKSGHKGFFSCNKCGKRTVSLGVLPEKPCGNCGEMKWSRCSMLREKEGPVLENEILLLRGEERGFVGADGGVTAAQRLLKQKRKGTAIEEAEVESKTF